MVFSNSSSPTTSEKAERIKDCHRNILDFVSNTGKRRRYSQVDGEDDAPARSYAPGHQSTSQLGIRDGRVQEPCLQEENQSI